MSYTGALNKLSPAKRADILGMMAEGVSLRAISRLTGASKNTIMKLLEDAGEGFSEYQDKAFRNLTCKRLQVDETWSFVHCKQRNVATAKAAPATAGDLWTWTAIDADTKLIPAWLVSSRDGDAAEVFIADLAERLANRVQLTTDGHRPYLEAVEEAFGADIDYAMLDQNLWRGSDFPWPLQSGRMRRRREAPDRRSPRCGSYQHQLRGTG